ncbi:MAG: hypothetical protein L0I84_01945 [Halomonas subglaciescola]|nr:hypothetical protein [Halomonas subglaciescola]
MTGIKTYAYTYLHGEGALQFGGRFSTLDALEEHLSSHQDGGLLFSDFKPPAREVLIASETLEGASNGLVLCPVTAAIVRRYHLAPERMEQDNEAQDGTLLGEPSHASAASAAGSAKMPLDDLPPAFKLAIQQTPSIATALQDANVLNMGDFRERWNDVPASAARTAAYFHQRLTLDAVDQSMSSVTDHDSTNIAHWCIKAADGFPPWVDSWESLLPLLNRRTHNVLLRYAPNGPQQLASISSERMVGWDNMGIKSLRTLLSALTDPSAMVDLASHDKGAPRRNRSIPRFTHKDVPPLGNVVDDKQLPLSLHGLLIQTIHVLPQAIATFDLKPIDRLEALVMRLRGDTLETCGQHFGVTRERIRQMEGRLCKHAGGAYRQVLNQIKAREDDPGIPELDPSVRRPLEALASVMLAIEASLSERHQAVDLALLSLLVDRPAMNEDSIRNPGIFEAAVAAMHPLHPAWPGYVSTFSHGAPLRAGVPNERLVLALPHEVERQALQDYIERKFIPSMSGLEPYVARSVGRDRLHQHGLPDGAADLLASGALRYWMSLDEEGKVSTAHSVSTPKRERMEVQDIIRAAKRPLHVVDDIYNIVRPDDTSLDRPEAQAMRWVKDMQDVLRSDDIHYPVLINNSYIATVQQIGLENANLVECAQYMASIMEARPDRQFAIRELAEALQKSGVPDFPWTSAWPGHPRITTQNFAQVILLHARLPNTRNMGRLAWMHGPWTDEPDTESRMQTVDFYKHLFRKHGRPLTHHELVSALAEVRGIGIAYNQIREANGIIRLEGSGRDTLYWDTELGPWPPESGAAPAAGEPGDQHKQVQDAETPSPAPHALSQAAIDACKSHLRNAGLPTKASALLAVMHDVAPDEAEHADCSMLAHIPGFLPLQGTGDDMLFWDTDLDSWDDDQEEQVEWLQEAADQWLRHHEPHIVVENMAVTFRDFYEFLTPLTDMEKATVLARHPAMKMGMDMRKRLIIERDSERSDMA